MENILLLDVFSLSFGKNLIVKSALQFRCTFKYRCSTLDQRQYSHFKVENKKLDLNSCLT